MLAIALCGVIALGSLVLPHSLQQRVASLSEAATSGGNTLDDGSLRGRKSENLAGLRMWAITASRGGTRQLRGPLPEVLRTIGIDPRAERRGDHNLYLESLAETGLLGTMAFFGVLWPALAVHGGRAPACPAPTPCSAKGCLVALGAFLICAVTLHSAYARYEWIFLGLGLAAGRWRGGRRDRCRGLRRVGAVVAWVYAGYPLMLALLGRLRPRPRRRAPLEPPLSVIVAAHNEVAVIADKVANVLASDYPTPLLELSWHPMAPDDGTVEAARRAGATRVLDLPRVGKLPALNRAAEISSGEILVFTDADTRFEHGRCASSSSTSPTTKSAAWRPTWSVASRRMAGPSRGARACTGVTSAS